MFHSRARFLIMVFIGMISAVTVSAAGDFRLSGPYQFQNLTVFIARSEASDADQGLLTLSEALEKKYVTVYETGQVGELEVENVSSYPVYVQSGMIVKGGKQDRVLRFDIIIRARSGRIPLASFCVEHGRWTPRGQEKADQFTTSSNIVSHRDIKIAAKAAESQQEVWSKVEEYGKKVEVIRGGRRGDEYHTTSLQLMQEDKEIRTHVEDYINFFNEKIRLGDDATGLIFAVNGVLSCADLYQSPDLFKKLYPQLLEAAALEAVAEHNPKAGLNDVTTVDVFRWMENADRGEYSIRSIDGKMELRTKENDGTLVFETYPNHKTPVWIHKNILAR